ncbi:MAG: hypothetical protein E7D78_08820, partial [Prevotella bivia]|nr:hypothetical protein [Prevotella bivia]
KGHSYFGKVGLVILTLLGLKYLPAWVKLVWLFHTKQGGFLLQMLKIHFTIKKDSMKFGYYPKK